MFDKRNMTITRRAAASGPCLADRVWLTPRRLEPCKGRPVLDSLARPWPPRPRSPTSDAA